MINIILKILLYSFVICILTCFFGVVYSFVGYCSDLDISFWKSMYLSFAILLNIPNIESILPDNMFFLVVIQKFINNIILAIFAAFIFYYIINKKSPIILPNNLFIRRRTSHGVEGQLAVALMLGNKRGDMHKIYDATAKLTYMYWNGGALNANTQVLYSVQTINNFNTFYFMVNQFPPHFFETIISTNAKNKGIFNFVIQGRTDPYQQSFIHEIQYTTDDIVFVKRNCPTVERYLCNKFITKHLSNLVNFFNNTLNIKIKIKKFLCVKIDLSIYEPCSSEEADCIKNELKQYGLKLMK